MPEPRLDPLTESRRAVQASLLPDVPDRPIGRIVGSVQTGTNSDLIAAVAHLYLTGSVCDVTYGTGGWWRRFTPDPFTTHDLDPAKGDGIDFTALPEPDNTYDAVTFDPPYVVAGGLASSTAAGFRDRFGLTVRHSPEALWNMIAAGLAECARVTKPTGFVLVKCADAVHAKDLELGHVRVLDLAQPRGLSFHDLIVHHAGGGPAGHNIRVVRRARRHHSYLLVFRKTSNG